MRQSIPVYQVKIDEETGLPMLDDTGCEVIEHVRDLIVPEPPTTKLTDEQMAVLKEEQRLQLSLEEPIQNL